jgi:hypothetical protein
LFARYTGHIGAGKNGKVRALFRIPLAPCTPVDFFFLTNYYCFLLARREILLMAKASSLGMKYGPRGAVADPETVQGRALRNCPVGNFREGARLQGSGLERRAVNGLCSTRSGKPNLSFPAPFLCFFLWTNKERKTKKPCIEPTAYHLEHRFITQLAGCNLF